LISHQLFCHAGKKSIFIRNAKDVFRLYYTSLSSDRQTIDVYVEDSFGRVQQLTFSFNNEREEGKKPASSRH